MIRVYVQIALLFFMVWCATLVRPTRVQWWNIGLQAIVLVFVVLRVWRRAPR